MIQIKLKISQILLVLCVLSSCQKDYELSKGDYLPLKVGTKYLYSYRGGYTEHSSEDFFKEGVCEWEFVDMKKMDSLNVYTVKQTFNGIFIHGMWNFNTGTWNYIDTTLINNERSTLIFKENKIGKTEITFPIMYGSPVSIYIKRYIETSQIDTCLSHYICLSKNVGIKYLLYVCKCNHLVQEEYTLLKGPL